MSRQQTAGKPVLKTGKPPNRKERRKELQATVHRPDTVVPQSTSSLSAKTIFTSPLFWVVLVVAIGSLMFMDYPRVSIHPGKSVRPGQPFEIPFVLKNEGYMPIDDIRYSLSMENIQFGQGSTLPRAYSGVNGTSISRLTRGESSTILLNPFIDLLKQSFGIVLPPKAVTSAEISIDFSYRPYLIPYTFSKHLRFTTKLNDAGTDYVWSASGNQK
ncbi:MAG TPA: hypothetical protein VMT71_05075 [Syntrophorhabdales bacterium]|nr:hypothetical protein [Syntrophorhabdales bacterium]